MLGYSINLNGLNIHGQLSRRARCFYFGLSLYLHHSLCVRAVKALAMLRASANASMIGLIKYALHINLMSWSISLQSGHFLMKSCGCSLISTVCIELRIGRFLEAERTTQDGGPFNTSKVCASLYPIWWLFEACISQTSQITVRRIDLSA